MASCNDLLSTLSVAGFSIEYGQFSFTGFPRPLWVHSDDIEVFVEHYSDLIRIEVKFEHHKALLKYGSDPETLFGMKLTCAEEWYPELELHFQKCVEYYDLQWTKYEELEDEVATASTYTLTGKFPAAQSDRILALLLEMRTILSNDS